MLAIARGKARSGRASRRATPVSFAAADATRLPLADASVDVWCAAFVLRNVPDLDAALAEARRVLRPGGRLGVLEITRVERGWLRPIARFHFERVVPLLGRVIVRHPSAYRYLPESVDHFRPPRSCPSASSARASRRPRSAASASGRSRCTSLPVEGA